MQNFRKWILRSEERLFSGKFIGVVQKITLKKISREIYTYIILNILLVYPRSQAAEEQVNFTIHKIAGRKTPPPISIIECETNILSEIDVAIYVFQTFK